MANPIYCSNCGAEMRYDMNFCPQCGAVKAGSETEKKQIEEMNAMARESGFMWVKFLLIVYAIPVMVVAIIGLINAHSYADMLWHDANFQNYITHSAALKNLTQAGLESMLLRNAVMALVSGACALAALVFVQLRKYWVVAFVCCIAATVFSVWSFIGIFVGIFVTWMVFDLKGFFEPMGKPEQAAE